MEGRVVQKMLQNNAEDHIENPFHQGLIEIMYKGEKGDIPILCSRHITLVTKYPNEVNKC